MSVKLIIGGAHPALGEDIAAAGGFDVASSVLQRLPDAELVELSDDVRGADVFVIQPTPPDPEAHFFELVLLGDAARRAGARHLTAVVPYLGYSRQDRRAAGRSVAVGARVVADILGTRFDRVVAVDLHAPAIEGFFAPVVEHLEAFGLFESRFKGITGAVVVAPDLGAAKLASRYAAALNLPFAVVHKARVSGTEVIAQQVTGDVQGFLPLIIDDMITTGGTVAAALRAVLQAGALPGAIVAATHGIFATGAIDMLRTLPIDRIIVTDSVPVSNESVEVVSLAPMLATVIRGLADGASIERFRSRA